MKNLLFIVSGVLLFSGELLFGMNRLSRPTVFAISRGYSQSSSAELCGICRYPGVQVYWPSTVSRGSHVSCFELLADPECDLAFAQTLAVLSAGSKSGVYDHRELARRLDLYAHERGFSSIRAHVRVRGLVGFNEIYSQNIGHFEAQALRDNAISNAELRRVIELREMLKDIVRCNPVADLRKPYDFRVIHGPIMVRFLSWTRTQGYASMQEYVRKHGIEAFADFYARQLDSMVNAPSA